VSIKYAWIGQSLLWPLALSVKYAVRVCNSTLNCTLKLMDYRSAVATALRAHLSHCSYYQYCCCCYCYYCSHRPLQEAITVLKQTLPVPPLARDSGIDRASSDHANDMSTSGQVSSIVDIHTDYHIHYHKVVCVCVLR
jgi:hypothetical protein